LIVIAFDAHVLAWNLDDNPPDEFVRHHIKEASFYGTNVYAVDLVIKIPVRAGAAAVPSTDREGRLLVNFIGLQENGMWPGKKSVKLRPCQRALGFHPIQPRRSRRRAKRQC
jgi:hypothetical protein